MDYFGILKKAWDITWRNKALWILGFFAVASSSSGGFNNTAQWRESSGSSDISGLFPSADPPVLLLVVLLTLLVVFILTMLVLGIAARGGLAYLVNEAEEGRPVHAREGWGVGFKHWGRTFMIGFVLALPIFVVVLLMAVILFGAGLGLATGVDAGAAAGLGFGGALCCMLPVFIIVIVGLGLAVSIIGELAVRYGVLKDITFGQAIRAGWDDLWAKRGAVVMWLVMLLPQFAYGAVLVVLAVIIGVPIVLLFVSGAQYVAIALGVLLILALVLPGAVYNTFYSASWTVFFRRMTGIEVVAPVAVTPAGGYMPPPPVPPAPTQSAPDSGDAPEV